MALSIEDVWNRMQNIYNKYAPELSFSPGATEGEIEELEGKLGVTLPEDYKDSLRLHNGVDIFPSGELLSTSRVYEEWKVRADLLEKKDICDDKEEENVPDDWNTAVKSCWWTKKWIGILADGYGNGECLDLDPGKTGVSGQVIQWYNDVEARPILANSFTQWLDDVASKIENGQFVYQDGSFCSVCIFVYKEGSG